MRTVHLHYPIALSLITVLLAGADPLVGIATAQVDTRQLLAAEARDIEATGPLLNDFEELADRLDTMPNVSRADFETLQRRSQTAKSALAVLQRQIPSVVTKLRSAGKWTQALDDGIVRKLQKSSQTELLQEVQAAGGARRLLEQATADIAIASAEIDSTLRRLQPKVAWQWLAEPFLGQPLHAIGGLSRLKRIVRMVKEFLDCVIGPCD